MSTAPEQNRRRSTLRYRLTDRARALGYPVGGLIMAGAGAPR
jgi:hypothetical protein